MKFSEIIAISGFAMALILLIWSTFLFFSRKKLKLQGKTVKDMAIIVCLFSFKEYFIPDLSRLGPGTVDFEVMIVITMSYMVTLYLLATIYFYDFKIPKKRGQRRRRILLVYVIMFCLSLSLTISSTFYLQKSGYINININDF